MKLRNVPLYCLIALVQNLYLHIEAKPYDAIIRFLQHDDPDEASEDYNDDEDEDSSDQKFNVEQVDDEDESNNHDEVNDEDEEAREKQDDTTKEVINDKPSDNPVVEEPKKLPSWVEEPDLIAEFESSQTERADDLSIKALQKRRAANSLRVYCEGIQEELERAKNRTNGLKRLDTYKLTSQLEANLARASLLIKQADLLDEKAREAKMSLEMLHSNDRDKILLRDCTILKIGPLWYSSREDVFHRTKEPLMAKLTGNSLVLYRNKLPQLTYYMVDIEIPTKPADSASKCFSFGYRGAEQLFCAATEQSSHTWMNAISEAWFCKHMGIKGTLISLKKVKSEMDEKKSILKHSVKGKKKDKGLVNMEVYVDDKNKTHLLVEGKEKPLSSISDIIDVNQIIQDKKNKRKDSGKEKNGN